MPGILGNAWTSAARGLEGALRGAENGASRVLRRPGGTAVPHIDVPTASSTALAPRNALAAPTGRGPGQWIRNNPGLAGLGLGAAAGGVGGYALARGTEKSPLEKLTGKFGGDKRALLGLLANAFAGPAARGVLGKVAPGVAGKVTGGLRGAAFDLGAGQAAQGVAERLAPPKLAFDLLVPSIAGSVLGGGLGAHLGEIAGQNIGRLGLSAGLADKLQTPVRLLGSAMGASVGKSIGDQVEKSRATDMPPVDPTVQDIPAWALSGASALRQDGGLRLASHDNVRDLLLGEIPGYSAVRGYQAGGIPGAIKGVAGQVIPAVLAGGLTHMAGKGLARLTGFDPRLPFTDMPLRDVATGTAATVAGTLGMQRLLGH
jgi:hypothetical protein